MAPSPRKKSNPTKIVKEIPESSERSRRTSTKLVTAATNSVVLQKNLDPGRSLSPLPPPPRNTRATPESSKTKPRADEKKTRGAVRPVSKIKEKNNKIKDDGKKVKNLVSTKKRKRDDENDNKKKTKVAEREDSVRRSRRETTRNSSLATLNSTLSDVEDKSRSVSAEPPVEEKKKKKPDVKKKSSPAPVSPARSKRRTTALSSLATKAALSQERNISAVSPGRAPSEDEAQSESEPESEPEVSEKEPGRQRVKVVKGVAGKPVRERVEREGQRRSVRSTTAISTLASNNAASQATFLVEESSDELDDEGEESSTESEEQYQEAPRRGRGRPSKAKPPALSPNNPFAAVTREYKEQQKIVAKLNRKRKSSLSPDERPRLLSEEENNRLFDSLFEEGEEDPAGPAVHQTNVREKSARSRKAARSSKKLVRSSEPVSNSRDNPALSTKERKTKSPPPKSEDSDSRLPSLTWAKTSPSTASSSRIVAPWRKLGEDKVSPDSKDEADDVYEFGGPVGETGLKGKTERSPERKMFLAGSRHGAYSGQLTALTWKQKLEQSNQRSQESQKSPNRLMFGSPRRDIGSPEGKKLGSISPKGSPRHEPSFRNSSPRSESSSKIGSPRSETSHKTGSPRVDPSHRIYSPRIDPSQRMGLPKVYGSPLSRMGARVGGSIKPSAGGQSSHQLSLTSLSSDYNIVAAVDKHHGANLLNTPPLAPVIPVAPLTPSHTRDEAQNPSEHNVKRKSFLLSRIFSKPPSKDQEDDNTEEDATATTSEIKYAEAEAENESKTKKPTEEVKKERKKKAAKDVEAMQDNTSKRPARNSTRTLNFKEASSDSDSEQSNSSDLGGFKKYQKKKLSRNVRAENPLPTGSIVCTSCQRDDINLVKQLVKKFATLTFATNVGPNTSHVVTGEGKRTLNLLKGLLQGCWIVSKDWAMASLEADHWVKEEPYEMVNFSPAVRSIRLERAANKGHFKSELFKELGSVFISPDCKAPTEDLKQLISSGGGSLSSVVASSKICVGEVGRASHHSVSEKWILDSVQFHTIMPFSDYPL